MTTRVRNHGIPIPSRVNARSPEKCRKPMNGYYPQSSTLPTANAKDIQDHEGAYEPRYVTDSRTYAADSPTDNDYKNSDERDSNDSMSVGETSANPDGNLDGEHHYRDIGADMTKREKLMQDVMYTGYPSQKRTPIYRHADNYDDVLRPSHAASQRRGQEYAEKKMMYDVTADPVTTQKMHKLRELQRRRDMAEKFYSHEIKRLIGDHQYEHTGKTPPMGRQSAHHHEKTYSADRATTYNLLDSLEQCGTMTTITRLDCGCAEQVIRPIFTTPSGRTQRRTCAQDQQVRMRMSAPNARFVHSQTTPGPRLKSKSFGEQCSAGMEQQQQQRVGSPTRKIPSESSVNNSV